MRNVVDVVVGVANSKALTKEGEMNSSSSSRRGRRSTDFSLMEKHNLPNIQGAMLEDYAELFNLE